MIILLCHSISLNYHTPFKVLFVFTPKLGPLHNFPLPLFSAPTDSLPVKSQGFWPRRSNPNEWELECHTLGCTAFNGAAQDIGGISPLLHLARVWVGRARKYEDYLQWTHCPNTGRGVVAATPIRNTNTTIYLETQTLQHI